MLLRPASFLSAIGLAWRFHRASRRGPTAHLAYLIEACVLRGWFTRNNVQHVHAQFGTNATAVAALCRALGGPPYSFTTHGPEEFDQPRALSLGEKVHRAAFAVAVCWYGKSQLQRWCDSADWPKIHVIGCGIDSAFSQDIQQFPVPDHPRFVCVGRLEAQKAHLVLLDAVKEIQSDGLAIEMVFVGEGSMRGQLVNAIRAMGLESTVRLAGALSGDAVRTEILNSRALVLSSFAEGLPVVLMEAMALGRPVIATWVAGVPELVDSSCGWLVPAGDVSALASALRSAMHESAANLETMAEYGKRKVTAAHSAEVEGKNLYSLFSSSGIES
jgi:colanic acid/amylovoran biosynthesis glycosyltransferase